MRAKILPVLAYMGAAATLVLAALTPFVLMGYFSRLVAATGIHVDPVYTGGTVARTLPRGAYQIDIYSPVLPHALQHVDPFVQIAFRPVSALPTHFSEAIDLDGDGQPDVQVSFTLPANAKLRPAGDVVALNGKYQSFRIPVAGSFSQLMVEANGAMLLRVPLAEGNQP